MTPHTTMAPQPDLTLDSQLCFALYAASNTIDQYYRPLLEAHDLTYAQYIVLMALAEEDQISITALATRLGLSKGDNDTSVAAPGSQEIFVAANRRGKRTPEKHHAQTGRSGVVE